MQVAGDDKYVLCRKKRGERIIVIGGGCILWREKEREIKSRSVTDPRQKDETIRRFSFLPTEAAGSGVSLLSSLAALGLTVPPP